MKARFLFAAVLLLGSAACSDDGDDSGGSADGGATTTTVAADPGDDPGTGDDPAPADPGTGGTDSTTVDGETTTTDPADEPVVEGACALLPAGTTIEGIGELPAGVAGGDDRRQVCTFTAGETGGVGITLAREAGDRFDDKVAASQNALGVDGEDVDGLGDRARYFFSDDGFLDGVGGVVVLAGGSTIDVTLQGISQAELRTAALGIAAVAVEHL